jgi:hypothetical protein
LKYLYQIAAVISLAALFSCKKHDEIEVRLVGEVVSRRSFAHIQFMDDEKEIDRYMAKIEKTNPTINAINSDSFLITQFERIGLVKKNEFIQSAFKPQTDQTTTFTDYHQQHYKLTFFSDSLSHTVHFRLSNSRTSIDIDTKADPLQNLDYAFLDIIQGGNKELVFLDDYHIMNGFNFYLKVYEIKTNQQ